jgi:hypothetical protein
LATFALVEDGPRVINDSKVKKKLLEWLGVLEVTQADSCGELMGLAPVYAFVCEVMSSLDPAELSRSVVSLRTRYALGDGPHVEAIPATSSYLPETDCSKRINPVSMWDDHPSGW